MSRRVQPTEEEVNTLPFNATEHEVYFNEETQLRSQFANWNKQPIQRYEQGPWENYHTDKPLTLDNWEKYYPFISEVQELDRHYYRHLSKQTSSLVANPESLVLPKPPTS